MKVDTVEQEYDRQAKFEANMASAVQASIMSQLQAGMSQIQTSLMQQTAAQNEQTANQPRTVLETQNEEIRRQRAETTRLLAAQPQLAAGSDNDQSRRRKSRRDRNLEPTGPPQQFQPTPDQQLDLLLQQRQQQQGPPQMIAAQSFHDPSMPSALTLDQIPANADYRFASTSSTGATSLASTLQVGGQNQFGNLEELSSSVQPLQSAVSLATTTSYIHVGPPDEAQPPSGRSSDLDAEGQYI